jgi:hypothetical protein
MIHVRHVADRQGALCEHAEQRDGQHQQTGGNGPVYENLRDIQSSESDSEKPRLSTPAAARLSAAGCSADLHATAGCQSELPFCNNRLTRLKTPFDH